MYRGLSLKFSLEDGSAAAQHSSGWLAPTNPITPADAVTKAAADDDKKRARVECDGIFVVFVVVTWDSRRPWILIAWATNRSKRLFPRELNLVNHDIWNENKKHNATIDCFLHFLVHVMTVLSYISSYIWYHSVQVTGTVHRTQETFSILQRQQSTQQISLVEVPGLVSWSGRKLPCENRCDTRWVGIPVAMVCRQTENTHSPTISYFTIRSSEYVHQRSTHI